MNNAALDAFEQTDYLADGYEEVLDAVRPAFVQLLQDLRALPDSADEQARLRAFSAAFDLINEHEDDIETDERETILGAIYAIGSLVGLPAATQYAEQWRGDW
jgi:hypothetical protein